MKDRSQRANVIRFLPHWEKYLAANGPEKTKRLLETGQTTKINRKDRFGLLQALGLTDKAAVMEMESKRIIRSMGKVIR